MDVNIKILYYFYLINRTCSSATVKPSLNSSSCYPLVNFTRPFCQNHGVTLPSFIYAMLSYQNWKNHEVNKYYDAIRRLGFSRIGRILSLDVTTVKKCIQFFTRYLCHDYFPSCDQTQSLFLKQKVCRESCLQLIDICGKMYEVFSSYLQHASQNQKRNTIANYNHIEMQVTHQNVIISVDSLTLQVR